MSFESPFSRPVRVGLGRHQPVLPSPGEPLDTAGRGSAGRRAGSAHPRLAHATPVRDPAPALAVAGAHLPAGSGPDRRAAPNSSRGERSRGDDAVTGRGDT